MNAIAKGPLAAAATTASQTVTPWLAVVLAVILLFGYDQGVISGALHGIKATFSLSALLVEVVTSWVTLGALFAALAGGELADRLGRERAVLIAGVVFTVGSLIEGLASDTLVLVGGRLVVGAIGNSFTFWLFALFCMLGGAFVFYAVPETKGRSLEQIQQIWKTKGA